MLDKTVYVLYNHNIKIKQSSDIEARCLKVPLFNGKSERAKGKTAEMMRLATPHCWAAGKYSADCHNL